MASRRDRRWVFAQGLVLLAMTGCGGSGGDPGSLGSVEGTVEGLKSAGLVLQLNGGNDLTVDPSATSFRFRALLADGAEYDVQVKTQPSDQVCTVTNGGGTIPLRLSVKVQCGEQARSVLGTVTGVDSGETVELKLNDQPYTVTGSGAFTFPNKIPYQAGYAVTVTTPPPSKRCTVTGAVGTMGREDVTSVVVDCRVAAPEKPTLSVSGAPKQLRFTWNAPARAATYRFYENPSGAGFAQRGTDMTATEVDIAISVHLFDWANARYRVEACNVAGCTTSDPIDARPAMLAAIGEIAGDRAAFSADSSTMAICDGADVTIYKRDGAAWTLAASIPSASFGATSTSGFCGGGLALSSDGAVLVVGAPGSGSSAAGRVFTAVRSELRWSPDPSPLMLTTSFPGDSFGWSIALSPSGNTLVVSSNGSVIGQGLVHSFRRSGITWSSETEIQCPDARMYDGFGSYAAFNAAETILGVGASPLGGTGTTYFYTPTSSGWQSSGTVLAGRLAAMTPDGTRVALTYGINDFVVYVMHWSGTTWTREGTLQASNAESGDGFGYPLAISADGRTVVVGAYWESGGAAGIDGNGADNSLTGAGAAYVFGRSGSAWRQTAYVKSPHPAERAYFGWSVALDPTAGELVVSSGTSLYVY